MVWFAGFGSHYTVLFAHELLLASFSSPLALTVALFFCIMAAQTPLISLHYLMSIKFVGLFPAFIFLLWVLIASFDLLNVCYFSVSIMMFVLLLFFFWTWQFLCKSSTNFSLLFLYFLNQNNRKKNKNMSGEHWRI